MILGSSVFWIVMGVLFVLVARAFKAFADDRGWILTWWMEIMAVLWYAILGLSLYAWGTLIGEGEGDAGFKLFQIGLFVCIVLGVGLVRLMTRRPSPSS